MPLIILNYAVAILCIIHAVKRSSNFTWISIILFIPGIGSVAYILAVFIPGWLNNISGQRAVQTVTRPMTRAKELRRLEELVNITPSIHNKQQLGQAYLIRDMYEQAIQIFEGANVGRYQNDQISLKGLIKACFSIEQYAKAEQYYVNLIEHHPEFYCLETRLIYAQTLSMLGKTQQALAEYEAFHEQYLSLEATCQYFKLLKRLNYKEQAKVIYESAIERYERSPKYYQKTQKKWVQLLSV